MELEQIFPRFHPHNGEQKYIPIGVSSTHINSIQSFLQKYTESDIIKFYKDIKSLPSEYTKELFCPSSLFPSKCGDSHRAALGKLFIAEPLKSNKSSKALLASLIAILKLNQLMGLLKQTNDLQLLDYPIKKEHFLEFCEAMDMALAISDCYGEFNLALGNVKSTLVQRQIREEQIRSENAQKANTARHHPMRELKSIIRNMFDDQRMYENPDFKKGNNNINYAEIADYIFWKLKLSEQKLFPMFVRISREIKVPTNKESVENHCKENNIRFNPIREIATDIKKYHETRINKK